MVEMLAVITIITILSAITIPSFIGAGTASQLTAGGNLVVDLVNRARQNAISKNVITALFLINQSSNTGSNDRLFVIEELDNPVANQWTQVSKWETLPQGVLVDMSNANTQFQSPTIQYLPASLNYQGSVFTSAQYLCQVFLPDGSLETRGSPQSPPTLHLVAGVMNGQTVVYTGTASNFYEVILMPYTGLPKINRP